MARKKSDHLTDGEQAIMQILWQRENCSVKEITEILSRDKDVAYTTVQTMCKILAEKGYATYHKEGRAFLYSAQITQKEAQRGAFTSLLHRFFGSSPELLAQHLMEETDLEIKDIEALQKKIDQADE
ncbi:BlaI/MecI/CopY family transcriptional regulator [Temperatibacter marinus]|uniref:BlaI/MecI/CopY family transcriptional regulator n=1 Tax=Temperatibacter marinus TaxID=1456591 RepID=A0AA52HAQ1_9PROT|nr:BlaI/MecI/CopY family transcriptional regulator [Temperatibacter marinus]WND03832.1 BlaI/MecI/CopY family transcriptional regulator [Temperatibacter marinus]